MNYLAISTAHEIIEYDICGSLDTDLFGINDEAIIGEIEYVKIFFNRLSYLFVLHSSLVKH